MRSTWQIESYSSSMARVLHLELFRKETNVDKLRAWRSVIIVGFLILPLDALILTKDDTLSPNNHQVSSVSKEKRNLKLIRQASTLSEETSLMQAMLSNEHKSKFALKSLTFLQISLRLYVYLSGTHSDLFNPSLKDTKGFYASEPTATFASTMLQKRVMATWSSWSLTSPIRLLHIV